MTVQPEHLAPTAYLHAATVVALADTAAGYGCLASLPAGKTGFTTIELKTNFIGTARVGELLLVSATAVHRGPTTQVCTVSSFPISLGSWRPVSAAHPQK